MKNLFLSAFLLFALLLVSCKKDKPYEQFSGSWSGTYLGEDTGTWRAVIDKNGKVQGTAESDSVPGFPFQLSGSITKQGAFEAQAAIFRDTITFEGKLTGSSATGTWFSTDVAMVGTWSGNKK